MEVYQANRLAYVAILAWPVVAIALFSLRPRSEALAWTILGGLLALPIQAALKIEMVPALDKFAVASLAAVIGCFLFPARSNDGPRLSGSLKFLLSIYILSPIVTSVLNGDLIIIGARILPGVGYYDGISAAVSQLIAIAPLLLGYRFVSRAADVRAVIRVLVIAGLAYSVLMLFEIRFSPQLSRWIYGVSPSFDIEMRYGGFRPVVFMSNGLMATMFLSTALIGAATLDRLRVKVGPVSAFAVASYFGFVLLLSKSAASLGYGLLGGATARWSSPKFQVRVAAMIAVIALVYPLLRISEAVPTREVVDIAEIIVNHERAYSLKFRFDEEEKLLARANERLWFGWGRFGRNRVYDDQGKDTSITDGQWILTLGQFGIVGFFAQFGLLTFPLFCAAVRIRRLRSAQEAVLCASLSIIIAFTVLDQLPNASITPWTWFLAGVVSGMTADAGQRSRIAQRTAPAQSNLEV